MRRGEWVDTHRAQRLQLLRQRRDGGPLFGVRTLRLRALALQLSELLLQPRQLRAVAAARLYLNQTTRQAAWVEGERPSTLCCVIFIIAFGRSITIIARSPGRTHCPGVPSPPVAPSLASHPFPSRPTPGRSAARRLW